MPDVILPVLNEVDAIPGVLASLPTGYRPIIVDNGSTDDSAGVARELGAEVVYEATPGFGSACFAGLVAATADIVCFMDCDGSFTGEDLPRVADIVQNGNADLALGARQPTARGAWPVVPRTANRLLAAYLNHHARLGLTDLGPMRAARRTPLLALGLTDRRFGWPLEMVLRASNAHWAITEVPVRYLPRIGRSKVTGTARGAARAARDMARIAREVR